jgi:hypothetical protein
MKTENMGSIYQGNMREAGAGAGAGLIIEGGRLVNRRPDGMTGIQQIAMARKGMRHENKVNTYAEGVSRGEQMSEMMNNFKNC